MNLYDIAIARKLSGGGGGGGSSDYSTAEVTFTIPDWIVLTFPSMYNDPVACSLPMYLSDVTAETLPIILYKGKSAVVANMPLSEASSVVVTGNIVYDSENNVIFVTGNGTITIS